jgi:hypothetical protein
MEQGTNPKARQTVLRLVTWYSLLAPILAAGIAALAFWFQLLDVGAVVAIAFFVCVSSLIAGTISAFAAKTSGVKIVIILGWLLSCVVGVITFYFMFFSMARQ